MGNFVSILTYEPNKSNEGFQILDENILKKEYQIESIPVISFKSVNFRLGLYIFDPLIEKYLLDIIKKFDVVHFTHPMRFASVIKVCKDLQIPTVLTLTDNWLLCPQGLLTKDLQLCDGPEEGRKCMITCKYDEQILHRFENAKFFFENIDKIFTGSEFVKQTFMENGWKKKIELNTFSTDYSFVNPRTEPFNIVFGFIGTLIWHKGLHVLIDAFKKVDDKKIKLKIYGSGPEGDPYPEHVMNLAKEDKRIEFCGTFEYEDLPEVMKEISIIIIPSTYKEIYPLVMQMSLAYKKPVISSNIGGMGEVIKDGINGYLFEISNVNQLSDIISMISNNPSIISSLRQNIEYPPRVEEEAFVYERTYKMLMQNNTK
jgi:glycosyltransferase involved in cell wall biosynthesis